MYIPAGCIPKLYQRRKAYVVCKRLLTIEDIGGLYFIQATHLHRTRQTHVFMCSVYHHTHLHNYIIHILMVLHAHSKRPTFQKTTNDGSLLVIVLAVLRRRTKPRDVCDRYPTCTQSNSSPGFIRRKHWRSFKKKPTFNNFPSVVCLSQEVANVED